MSSRHVTETIVLQTYSLQIIGPISTRNPEWTVVLRQFQAAARETEENLTDLLPEGYSVRIREWDAEEEHPHE